MTNYTPDSYIESSHEEGYCTDDAGYCDECGAHLDSGHCACPPTRCDNCERGMEEPTPSGCCAICDIEYAAQRQLTWPAPVQEAGLLWALKQIERHFQEAIDRRAA